MYVLPDIPADQEHAPYKPWLRIEQLTLSVGFVFNSELSWILLCVVFSFFSFFLRQRVCWSIKWF